MYAIRSYYAHAKSQPQTPVFHLPGKFNNFLNTRFGRPHTIIAKFAVRISVLFLKCRLPGKFMYFRFFIFPERFFHKVCPVPGGIV